MKISVIVLFLTAFNFCGIAQEYKQDFEKYRAANDSLSQIELLNKWENENPDDAELYTSYLNFYYAYAKKEIIAIEPKPNSKESLEMFDSINNIKAYINHKVVFNDAFINKGFEYINIGIKKYPNRLDMRFGKIHLYSEINYWEDYSKEILKLIEYSSQNENQWTWTNNEKLDTPEEFFLNTIQEYTLRLYSLNDDNLLPLMRSISERVLKYYPNNLKSLSNLAVTYLITGEYEKALDNLIEAEKINPKDFRVLSNIAQGYKLKGDIEKSIEYYEKTYEYGDEQAKEFATEQIRILKKTDQ